MTKASKVAFGFKSHSGWAALVVLGEGELRKPDGGREIAVVDRRRIDLVDNEWAKAPYHAAEELKPAEGRALVKRGVAQAHRVAERELRAAVRREEERGNQVAACAVLVGEPMPEWSTDEIMAVHFRMHKAEGVLFREVLVRAAEACGLRLAAIPEKRLKEHASTSLGAPAGALVDRIAALGKSVGPPWGKDQKDAALAAFVALRGRAR